MSRTALLSPKTESVIVTTEAGSRPVGTEASRRSARSPASALQIEERELDAGGLNQLQLRAPGSCG